MASVFLVHGLTGDAEDLGDVLPGPAELAGVAYLKHFQPVQETAQGGDGAQPGPWIRTVRRGHQRRSSVHTVNLG